MKAFSCLGLTPRYLGPVLQRLWICFLTVAKWRDKVILSSGHHRICSKATFTMHGETCVFRLDLFAYINNLNWPLNPLFISKEAERIYTIFSFSVRMKFRGKKSFLGRLTRIPPTLLQPSQSESSFFELNREQLFRRCRGKGVPPFQL